MKEGKRNEGSKKEKEEEMYGLRWRIVTRKERERKKEKRKNGGKKERRSGIYE